MARWTGRGGGLVSVAAARRLAALGRRSRSRRERRPRSAASRRAAAADLAASLSTALALDAAANLLRGPPATPPRPLRRAGYEVHAAGLAFDVVPIAFPEAITTRAGDTSVLAGHFDDRGLTVLTRRITVLGGHLLAIFPAEEPHAPHPAS